MTGPIKRLTFGSALLIGVIGPTLALPAAVAAPSDTGRAIVRAAHFSPTTPGVDVYLGSFAGPTSKQWLSSLRYGAVSPYQQLAPGLYTVSMRMHGAAATSTPILSWTLNARAGKAYTVAGVGAGASVKGVVLPDDLTAPPAGHGRVRVIQAASRAPVATVRAQPGPVIAQAAAFGTATGYALVPAGTWPVEATSTSSPSVQTSATVTVASGEVQSVLLLDAKTSGITVRTVLDSAGAAASPVGPVPAGGGGTATVRIDSPDHRGALGMAGALLLTLLGGAAWARRRPSIAR